MAEAKTPDCFDTNTKNAQREDCDGCLFYDVCDNPELRDDEDWSICAQCFGSGEGQYNGTICSRCKGSGEIGPGGETTDESAADYYRDMKRDEALWDDGP